ncbi:MAG TPA: sce7726 family protein [Candidatus Dormibacteraeota bacterium]|nr:sce7726 family protein [Candidatus Dormibacteraeota bacterium]
MHAPMRDQHIRPFLLRELALIHAEQPDTLIVEELGVRQGDRRVDVAAINGELHGYEIKSEADDLERLAGQAEAYGAVFDRMTLVAATCHVADAARMIPAWYGIIEVDEVEGRPRLTESRPANPNPGRDALSVAQLLWRDEALVLLARRIPGQRFDKCRRRELIAQVALVVPLEEIGSAVRAALKVRTDWRGAPRSS